jgi:hypothetical protein
MSNSYIQNVTGGPGILSAVSPSGSHYQPSDSIPNDGALRSYGRYIQYYNAASCCWMDLRGDTLYVELSADVQVVIDWAKNKMTEDEHIKNLAEKYPALKKAKENYDVVKALVENEN